MEFTPDNYKIYSIELAHPLFAAASEVDVIAKLLCRQLDPQKKPSSINDIVLRGFRRDQLAPQLPS